MRKIVLILILVAALAALTVVLAGCRKETNDTVIPAGPGAPATTTSPLVSSSPASPAITPATAPEPESTQDSTPESTPASEPAPAIEATPVNALSAAGYEYEIIQFGGYDWRIIGESDGRALIVSDLILEIRSYDDGAAEFITWETSGIRSYLNGEFIVNTFSEEEKARIIETTIINDDNQWFSTPGGSSTTDKVFLLSLADISKYFGDSGQLDNPEYELWIGDEYNSNRICEYDYGEGKGREALWWWLRSPGRLDDRVAIVADDGFIFVYGGPSESVAGIRPALWLDIGESGRSS